ncbi:N-acetylmuramoyl-L-alanine amidase [Bradyrhizobium sp. 6(2017)]|uniref:N-acetylmuramoyl-L-alanine amidase n=1 Tax=Bradyrhizobium sp. 6(2017) TaxID=1197460 RepID=UPI0013E10B3E|nr:N-acetylmuramoyl-L-alanine amidase [Bradyrhizobium sp. 6(2017)]QIG93805.1 hypothetical protein G6P99_15775 [Bradyrhizobium sp. 6(2017)]
MATEQEELRLTVTLADNASAGLTKLNEEVKLLGSGAGQQHLEKFKRETGELQQKIKGLGNEIGETFKGLGMLRGGLAAGAAGLALFGFEIMRQSKALVEYAEKIRTLNQQAKQIGVSPSQYKDVIEQLKAFGISGETAANSVSAVSAKIADLQRQGSQLRLELLKNAGPDAQSVANMQAYLDRLTHAKDITTQLNIIREGGEQVYRNAIRAGASEQEAANRRNNFWQLQGYNAQLAAAGALTKLSAEEQKLADARQANAVALANQWGQVTKKYDDLVESMKQPFIPYLITALKLAEGALDSLTKKITQVQEEHLLRPDKAKESIQEKFDKFGIGGGGGGRSFEDRWKDRVPQELEKNTEATKQLTELLRGGGYQPTGFGGGAGGGGIIPAAYSPGGGGPFGPRGGGGMGRPFGGGGYADLGRSAPYGSDVGAGSGAGAGSTPAHGGGGGGTPNTKGPISLGKGDDPRGMEPYIRETAKKYGVDPDTAVRVAKSEGLRTFLGDRGKSGGAFQLYTGGGLGNEFQKKTGLDPLDPANEKATIDYALSNVGKTGWRPYHGAARVGVGPREGLPGGPAPNGQTAGPGSGAGAGDTPAGDLPPRVSAVGGGDPAAFITHHTGGRGSVAGVQNTLRQRGLGVQYVMDREGNIVQTGSPGASHMRTGWGKGAGLSNRNVVGMEIIAKDDKDVTPQQAQAYAKFMALRYPNTPIFGHGEVNPGHKEADEGLTAKRAALAVRDRQQIDKTQAASTKVEGTGKISVDVNAPKGTSVGAEGGGLFKNVEINRQTQMEPARRGPGMESPPI